MAILTQKSLSWVVAAAMAVAVVALAGIASLTSVGTLSAATPTTVNVFTSQQAGIGQAAAVASTVNNGVATIGVYVDVDDAGGDVGGADLTNETLVTLSTSIGFWTGNGLSTLTLACSTDDDGGDALGTTVPGTVDLDTDGGGADLGSFVSQQAPGADAGGDTEAEAFTAGGGGLTTDTVTAADPGDLEGCLGVEAFISSLDAGTTAITALATNGGKQGAATGVFAPATGSASTLTIASSSDYIAANASGYASPDDEATVTASVRDSNGNSVAATSSVKFDITNNRGGLAAVAAAPVCTGVTAKTLVDTNDDDDASGTGEIGVDVCASATDLGDIEIKASLVGSSLTATRTIHTSGVPAVVKLEVEPFPSAVSGAVATTAKATVTDTAGNMAPNGTVVTFTASGTDTAVSAAGPATVAGVANTIIVTNTQNNTSIAVAASVPAANGAVISDGLVVNVAAGAPPAGGGTTPPAGGTITGATLTPGQLSIGTGNGSLVDLGASAVSQGCTNPVLWLNNPSGGLIGFFPTATLSAPNVAANAAFGTSGYNGGILVDCN